jgi:hypothetical protein
MFQLRYRQKEGQKLSRMSKKWKSGRFNAEEMLRKEQPTFRKVGHITSI